MKSFGEFLAYYMPILLLVGPILLLLGETYTFIPFIGAVCLGMGLFTLSIKVDIILGHIKKDKSE